ncbi:hypothetical protein HNQ44_002523 [Planomicrobium koreense]|uniref:Bacterial Ig domain-containing protein n=1 Tax=Planococcus koreensis TaxID=112331 RepID=A0A7W8CSZ6_9BACL|nr:Ig-like domain-containing protein [Planococcus koreensis]MBB5181078.1 hypothetical protein [Planococcus koreensis]
MGKKLLFTITSLGLMASLMVNGVAQAETGATENFSRSLEKQIEKQLPKNIGGLQAVTQFEAMLKNAPAVKIEGSVKASSIDYGEYAIEQEYNDDFGYADSLSFDKPIYGQLLPYDDIDFYKITVPRDGLLLVGGESNTYAIDLLFLATEKDFVESSKLVYLGTEYDEYMEIQAYQAKAGTYYVAATDYDYFDYAWDDNTEEDIYMLAAAFSDNVAPGKPTVNKVDNNDVAVTGKAEANSTVTVKNGTTVIGSAKASSTGVFSVKVAVQKAGSTLAATAKDSSGNISAATTTKVVDVVAPGKPTVNKVDNNDVVVTGKAEANSTITVKKGTTILSSIKASSTGTFLAKIAVQKAGTALAVTAKDSAGNISAATAITVADVIAPAKPVVNKVDSNDLKVTGKAEANSTVAVKNGTTLLGYAKASSTGYYSVPIKAQKRGVTITVTAKDKAGNISAKASLVVVSP